MNAIIKGAAIAAAVSVLSLASAASQNAERVYDNGPVWAISYIETKPGMFDDYIAYLSGPWRTIQEAGKRRGDVLDYKVLAVESPRDGEPDVILIVQLKNMAVFDRPLAELERDTTAVFGSVPKSNQAAVKREDVRVFRGALTARELRFIK